MRRYWDRWLGPILTPAEQVTADNAEPPVPVVPEQSPAERRYDQESDGAKSPRWSVKRTLWRW